jgi:hypothetical protein
MTRSAHCDPVARRSHRALNADNGCFVVWLGATSCHVPRCRPRHDIDEGGATVLDISSFSRAECGRVLARSTGQCEPCLGGHGLIPGGNCMRTGRCPFRSQFAEGQRPFRRARYECSAMCRVPFVGRRSNKKEVCTKYTLWASDWGVLGSDRVGFRMFPGESSVCRVGNAVRVPPRAQHSPSSEGFLL